MEFSKFMSSTENPQIYRAASLGLEQTIETPRPFGQTTKKCFQGRKSLLRRCHFINKSYEFLFSYVPLSSAAVSLVFVDVTSSSRDMNFFLVSVP